MLELGRGLRGWIFLWKILLYCIITVHNILIYLSFVCFGVLFILCVLWDDITYNCIIHLPDKKISFVMIVLPFSGGLMSSLHNLWSHNKSMSFLLFIRNKLA